MSDLSPTQTSRDGVTIIEFGPKYKNVDERVLAGVQDFLLETVERINPPVLVLDLSHTQFFGSAFIELMVRVWNRIKKRGGKFALCGLQEYCDEIIRVAQLDTVWNLYPDQDAAVQGVNAQSSEGS
jgi:anti-sigma B factor antagonist